VPIRDLVDDQTERDDIEQGLREVIVAYRASLEPERRVLLDRYRLIDFARKVVGVGSVGTRAWMALLIAVSDIFLGWVRVKGIDGQKRDFYLRQLRDWKGLAEIGTMAPSTMSTYGELCGWTLARAHARSGDRVAIAAYLGSSSAFEVAIREFASTYADQNERDHRVLVDAIAAGRIAADKES
jgi:hypothetical protein